MVQFHLWLDLAYELLIHVRDQDSLPLVLNALFDELYLYYHWKFQIKWICLTQIAQFASNIDLLRCFRFLKMWKGIFLWPQEAIDLWNEDQLHACNVQKTYQHDFEIEIRETEIFFKYSNQTFIYRVLFKSFSIKTKESQIAAFMGFCIAFKIQMIDVVIWRKNLNRFLAQRAHDKTCEMTTLNYIPIFLNWI